MDMLVKLYGLPEIPPAKDPNIKIRRGLVPEKHLVSEWVRTHFSDYWASEIEVAFSHQPVSCFLAIDKGELVGFACYDTTFKGFFGPTGVVESCRGKGIGKILFLQALHGLREAGYVYGIIGGVGPVEFYQRTAGALVIEDSTPAGYEGLLRKSS